MENHEVQTSPQIYARIGGALYLITIVVGIFNEAFIKGRIIVRRRNGYHTDMAGMRM